MTDRVLWKLFEELFLDSPWALEEREAGRREGLKQALECGMQPAELEFIELFLAKWFVGLAMPAVRPGLTFAETDIALKDLIVANSPAEAEAIVARLR